MKVWLMVGDTYESKTSHAVFKDKPQRHQVVRFILDHYQSESEYKTEEYVLSKDYTIRCHTHDMKTGWSSKVRDFNQYVDDILACIDGNDGNDYGTYFCMTEMDLIE